ncbi:MAG: metallophosphoesterase [Nibricoccus sp.]
MPAPTIRIFSDLHFLESACRARKMEQLHPLLDGADELISNGDLIDTQNADRGHAVTRELKTYFSAHAPTIFLTGNHDPDISETHELLLANDGIWITHGDILYDEMVPWSREIPEIRRRLKRAWANMPVQAQRELGTRLRTFRQICHSLPRPHDPCKSGLISSLTRYFSVVIPPRCAVRLLHTWATMSRHAARVAREHRATARFIVFGHTHLPGVWRRADRVVINTGSFCGPLSAQAVDLQGEELRLRPIEFRRGEFRLLAPTKTFALPAPVLSPLHSKT